MGEGEVKSCLELRQLHEGGDASGTDGVERAQQLLAVG